MELELSVWWIVVVIVVFYLISCINVLAEYERGVIFRLGRALSNVKGPGLIFVFKPIDRLVRVSLRVETMDVPAQDIVTRDNVTIGVPSAPKATGEVLAISAKVAA